ncbi:MAG: sodium:proton antiporter [Chlamydiae bacterium RIFCSPLOWO2_01_FULL_28_7]|nr:MAG: sodium:proton antiporter [Chlamydiae bacterium RIFCSPLOWO2_01_FULL_28_7]
MDIINNLIILVFVIGYLAVALECYIKINKTASAILMAVFTWILLYIKKDSIEFHDHLIDLHIGDASQIIFFLLGAMTLVELIDSHQGFKMITNFIKTKSQKKLIWIIAIVAFFISAVLDNLTTTIVMISILRKLIPEGKERRYFGATVVIAANAGGAWTPIGDVTTTMLWIKGQITSISIMKSLLLPSIFSMIVSVFLIRMKISGKVTVLKTADNSNVEPGAKTVLILGILSLIFVPIFRYLTDLPPFMGMFIGLAVLWIVTDIMHSEYEHRTHLRVPHVLKKIDISGVLFFLAILLAINTLEMVGILKYIALYLDRTIGNLAVISTIIGFLSAIVDNVPLVAATMGMYDLTTYPTDSSIWQMIAYAAGTGGSILIIGSAAGVALMGLEKIDFIWYLKKISLSAFTGYVAGMALYLILNIFY